MTNSLGRKTALYATSALSALVIAGSPVSAQDAGQDTDESSTLYMEEVVVTARFREEGVQDVGGSITALTGRALQEQGINSVRDLAAFTPSLNLQDRGPGRNEISIRGVGRSVFQQDIIASAANIGVYFDDVPVNVLQGAQIDIRSFDLGRVEVLRGPQGTLFGEGAQGGAIRYFTADPDLSDYSVEGELRFAAVDGGDEDIGGGLSVNIPLVEDKLGIRLMGNRVVEPGYIDNAVDGTEDTNDYDAMSFRAVILAEPNDRLKVRLMGAYSDADQGAFAQMNGDPNDQTLFNISSAGSEVDDEYFIASANISYKFDKFSVTSITSYFERNRDRDVVDAFFTNQAQAFRQLFAATNPFVAFGGPDLSGLFVPTGAVEPVFSVDQSSWEQISQEIRFVSDFDGPFNFVAGGFFRDFDQRVESTTRSQQSIDLLPITLFNISLDQLFNPASAFAGFTPTIPANPSPLGSELSAQLGLDAFFGATGINTTRSTGQQFSAFAEFTYEVNDKLTLIGGIRSHNEELDASVIGANYSLLAGLAAAGGPGNFPPAAAPELGDVDVNVFLPKAAIEYKATEELLLYASYSEGVRNGNINSGSTADTLLLLLGAEVAQDITTFEEERVRALELGAKYASEDGRIIANIAGYYNFIEDLQSFITFAGPPAAGIIDNVGDGRTYGFEADISYSFNENVRAFIGGNYTNAKISDVQLDPNDFLFNFSDGQPIPFIPDYTVTAGLDTNFPLGNSGLEAFARTMFTYTGEYSTFADGPAGTDFNPILGDYGLLDLAFGVRNERWSLDIRVNNLLNEREIIQASPTTAVLQGALGGFDFAPADAPVNFSDDFQITRPRTVLVTLGFQY